jgi:hypothetical protein
MGVHAPECPLAREELCRTVQYAAHRYDHTPTTALYDFLRRLDESVYRTCGKIKDCGR